MYKFMTKIAVLTLFVALGGGVASAGAVHVASGGYNTTPSVNGNYHPGNGNPDHANQNGYQTQTAGAVYQATLTGDREVPPVTTNANGAFNMHLDDATGQLMFDLSVQNGVGITDAHLHCAAPGQNGPIIVFLRGSTPAGVNMNGLLASAPLLNTNILPAGATCATPITDDASLQRAIEQGIIYVNVHTLTNPNGEIRGWLTANNIPIANPYNGNQNTKHRYAADTRNNGDRNVDQRGYNQYGDQNYCGNTDFTNTGYSNNGNKDKKDKKASPGNSAFGRSHNPHNQGNNNAQY